MIQALSSGIPTIASDAGGNTEIVKDRKTGLLFRKGDARDLVRAIRTLAEQPAMRQAVSEEGRRVARGYSSSRQVGEMAQYLEKTAGLGTRTGA